MNIQEDYVSFETAKRLKEKGFDECPLFRYDDCGYLWVQGGYNKTIKWHFPAPTLQMAMKWLREEQNLFIHIQCYGCESDEKAHFEYSYVISEYIRINNNICTTVGLEQKKAKSRFHTYEEAVEAAIKYCLEHLI